MQLTSPRPYQGRSGLLQVESQLKVGTGFCAEHIVCLQGSCITETSQGFRRGGVTPGGGSTQTVSISLPGRGSNPRPSKQTSCVFTT